MKISKATRKFENWLGKRIRLVKSDLDLKHTLMAEDSFRFLRGTFYRWAQVWEEACPALAKAPTVLAVGDLHVENFGTWRDGEGRLIWGVNDFDEAYPMPYTSDLLRLAVSANLAAASGRLKLSSTAISKAILDGYSACLKSGGLPFVLEEQHTWLRAIALGELRNPEHFWNKMDELPTLSGAVSKSVRRALESLLPKGNLGYRVAHRVAGVGSLGHERFVAIADFAGARIAREAKATSPSACVWAYAKGSERILYEEILQTACRALDPFVRMRGRWLVRRLAPDCSRVELTDLPAKVDEKRLLESMGFETANIHFGSEKTMKAVRRDIGGRGKGWLHEATKVMVDDVTKDYEDWRTVSR
jgi:hypothetical protein